MAMFLSARNCQMLSTALFCNFSDMFKSSAIIFQTLFFFMMSWQRSFEQLTDAHNAPPAFPVQHWPQSCMLKASRSWSHLSPPRNLLWTSFTTQKHVRKTWCYLHTLSEAFQVPVTEFSPIRSKMSGLFVFPSSLAEWHEKEV